MKAFARLGFFAAGLLLALAPVAHADDDAPAPPKVGDHVRVSLLGGPAPVTGRLLVWNDASLGILLDEVAEPDTAARMIPRASIASVELGKTHSHFATG